MTLTGSKDDKINFLLYSGAILMVSICCFFLNYHYPPDLYWDENYHIAFAYKYIHGIFYQEAHPPLGKLLIAAGERIIDPNSGIDTSMISEKDFIKELPKNFSFMGVRFFPALFACFSGYLFFVLLCLLTQHVSISFGLTGLYIFDNALNVHFRGAMLDGIQMFFILLSICTSLWIWRRRSYTIVNYGLLGVFTGLALATKVNALILIILAAFLIFEENKPYFINEKLRSLKTIALKCIQKGSVYIFGITIMFSLVQYIHVVLTKTIKPGKDYVISDAYQTAACDEKLWNPCYTVISIADWYKFAKKFTSHVPSLDPCNKNENGSHPVGWPIGNKSINYRWVKYYDTKEYHAVYLNSRENKPINMEDHSGLSSKEKSKYIPVIRYLYMQGNPLVWLIGLVAVILSISLVVSNLVYGLKIKDKDTFALIVLFLCMYLGYMATVITVDRVLYLYHYMIPLVFSIILASLNFIYLLRDKIENSKSSVTVYVCLFGMIILVFAVFMFYAPFTYYMPLTEDEFQARNLFKFWGMKSVN